MLTGISDAIDIFRADGRHVAIVKLNSLPTENFGGAKTPNSAVAGIRRLVGISSSADLLHWTMPHRIFVPGGGDRGETDWKRDRQPFLQRASAAGWDHAMAWADNQVVDGDRTLIYYGGYDAGHKLNPQTGRSLGLATLPLDRYVSRSGESITTVPLAGCTLTLNARGTIKAIVGGSVCTATGNGVALRPHCTRRLPAGRNAIRFDLRRGRLFAFSLR